MVIPAGLQQTYLTEVHKGHLGHNKCLERMKAMIYWPGCSSQLRDLVESCAICQAHRKDPPSSFAISHEVPQYPMQCVATDLFYADGENYILTVDHYSKWVDCHKLKETRTADVVEVLRQLFLNFGCPETLLSDNGPQFSSREFQCFLEAYKVRHITSSPLYPQSNGLVERMVQTVKNSLQKTRLSSTNHTLGEVLATLRSTPLGNGLPSPAVLLQSRNLRDGALYTEPYQLQHLQECSSEVISLLQTRQAADRAHKSGVHPPPQFSPGQMVYCKRAHRDWVPGQIVGRAGAPGSYIVRLQSGTTLRRNLSFISPIKPSSEPHSSSLNLAPNPAVMTTSTTTPSVSVEGTAGQLEPNWPSEGGDGAQPAGPDNSVVESVPVTPQQPDTTSRTTRSGRIIVKPVRFRD